MLGVGLPGLFEQLGLGERFGFEPVSFLRSGRLSNFFCDQNEGVGARIRLMGRIAAAATPRRR